MWAVLVVQVIRNKKRETQAKMANHFSPPAIVEAGAGLAVSKWKMTTSQGVSIRPASAAPGGGFILVDGNVLLF